MSSEIEYIHELGENRNCNLKLYVLSTCGHCHRALTFLRNHSIDFKYLYVDLLDRETIRYVRDGLREKFNMKRLKYPFLVINEEKYLVGFDEESYKELFGMTSEVEYTLVPGENKSWKIKLHALSTCGFCKLAMEFLRNHSIEFEYIFCDLLSREVADKLNEEIIEICKEPSKSKDEFMRQARFPFLVVEGRKCLGGFNENTYKEFFNIQVTLKTEDFGKKDLLLEEEKIMTKKISLPKGKKTLEDTKLFAEMVAKHQRWELNRDEKLLQILREGLTTNWNRYGYFSCPCRLADGIREKDKDIICPCEYAKPDIDEFGYCYCGLYLSKEFFASGKPTSSIPERRPE